MLTSANFLPVIVLENLNFISYFYFYYELLHAKIKFLLMKIQMGRLTQKNYRHMVHSRISFCLFTINRQDVVSSTKSIVKGLS